MGQMKKYFFGFAVIASVMLTASCNKEEIAPVFNGEKTIISVSIPETKTQLGELSGSTYSVLWSAGDKVSVNGKEGSILPEFVGKNDASFAVEGILEAPYTVLYPYDKVKFEKGVYSVNVPAQQSYKEDSFSEGADILVGYSKADTHVALTHLMAFVKVSFGFAPKSVTLEAVNGEAVSGVMSVSADSEGVNCEPLKGSSTVSIAGLPASGNTSVIFAVPAAQYANGFRVKVVDENGFVYAKNAYASGVTLKRNSLVNMPQLASLSAMTKLNEKCVFTYDEFRTAAQAAAESDVVVLGADLDLAGAKLTSVETLAGTVNGNGYSIKNAVLSNGVFTNVAATGVVKNMVIDASCTATADDAVFGALVKVNAGLVSGCVNNANISTTANHAAGAIAGLVGQSNGIVENCVNNGNIKVESASITGAIYYGGVVGQITLTKVESTKVLVNNCANSGNIAIHCAATPKNAYIGGVVGGNTATKLADIKLVGSVENCFNSGNIEYGFGVLSSGTYTDIGGVIGYLDGHLRNCKNTGNVAYTLATGNQGVNATCPAVGGVAAVVVGNVENLVNRGNVTINGVWAAGTAGNAGAGGYHQPIYAGVVAKHGTNYSAADNNLTADNLENYGTISGIMYMKTGGGTIHMLGGVLGTSNGKLTHLYNHGTIDILIGGKSNYVGGIIGHHSGLLLSDCINYADMTVDGSDQVLTSQVVSGIVAYELVKGGVLTNLENRGKITLNESHPAASTSYQYIAGVMGNYSGNTQTLTNCVNRGDIISNTTKKIRLGGVVGAIYDSSLTAITYDKDAHSITDPGAPGIKPLTDCHNYGNIVVNKAGNPGSSVPGSNVGGLAAYCSIGMEGCSNSGNITLTDCASDTSAGLLAAAINRRYQILATTIGGKLSSNVATNKLGLVAGELYTDPAIYDLGSAEKPLFVDASVTINGSVPEINNIDTLVAGGNDYNKSEQVLVINVQRK